MKRSAFIGTTLAAAAAIPLRAPAREIEARVRTIATTFPGTIGIFARTMAPGPALCEIRAFEQFPSASTIKALVMTTAFCMEEQRPGVMQDRITYDRRRLIGGSDYMQFVPDGSKLTVHQLILPMIQLSDNTAANLLIGHFGTHLINAIGVKAGMHGTHLARQFVDYSVTVKHERNVTTPYDMARLLYLIEEGAREDIKTIVSPENCRTMVRILLGQTDRDKIPAGLPAGTPVANKTGEIDGTRDDIAIVEPFGDSPFILSIYSKDVNDYIGCLAAIRSIARITYDSVAGTDL